MVGGAGDLDDLVVLNVEFEVAANTAVRADGFDFAIIAFAVVCGGGHHGGKSFRHGPVDFVQY